MHRAVASMCLGMGGRKGFMERGIGVSSGFGNSPACFEQHGVSIDLPRLHSAWRDFVTAEDSGALKARPQLCYYRALCLQRLSRPTAALHNCDECIARRPVCHGNLAWHVWSRAPLPQQCAQERGCAVDGDGNMWALL